MTFQLSDVNLDTEFGELIECQWLAHENPFQPFYGLFCPIYESGHEASMKESTSRFLSWARHDPHERWLKVVDEKTGRIVGGALYKVYEGNPFAHESEEIVDWYPDDSRRDYVSQAIVQMDVPRMEMATRPQVFLNILFTHPDYRRKGVGSMLLQWGIDTAKRLDVEFWLNATPMGKPLYERFGFELVKKNPLIPKTRNPDEKWKQMEMQFSDVVFWTMWLPKKGQIGADNAKKPWEQ